jgi:hypothetical protein
MYKVLYVLIIMMGISCAQVTSLNLKKHQFGQIPTKIVWIQVAGLQEEHLAMLKFSKQSAGFKTSFEEFLCIGKSWEYNLFKIRPKAYATFQSQLTGKKNIKNTCEDYSIKPIWKYVIPKGYQVGIFEGEMSNENSLIKSKQCKKPENEFLDDVTLWKMNKPSSKGSKLFHLNEKRDYKPSTVYYDKSCLTGDCYSTLSQNIIGVHKEFTRKSKNYVFMVRDFNFSESLNRGNYKKYKSDLIELEKAVRYFQEESEKRTDMLVLVTTAGTKNIEFPRSGREWQSFEQKGTFLTNKKTTLISTVFATGARAENFCGIYDQSNILSRIFSGAKQQGLELAIINPFE